MRPHGKSDTGVDAGRNHAALKIAEPGRWRARSLAARGLAAVLILAFAALLVLPSQALAQNSAPTFDDGTSTSREFEETIGAATVTTASNIETPIAATDTDTGDTLEYTLSGTDAAKFTVDTGNGQIKTVVGETYDHEAKASYAVTVTVEDGNGGSDSIDVTLNVTNQDEAPLRPVAPTVRGPSSNSTTSLRVIMTAPDNLGRPPITRYKLRTHRDGFGWSNLPYNPSSAQNITGITSGKRYHVQFRVKNDEGEGPWSPTTFGYTKAHASGMPDISGTARVGRTLTAGTLGISDGNGKSKAENGDVGFAYTYQWVRSVSGTDTDISGETASTYTLTAADLGNRVKVKASFTDNAGYAEGPLTSNAYPTSGSVQVANVTISAASPSEHYSTSHGATFTVTRTGVPTSALTVTVNLSQDRPFLDESELLREVTIDAGSPSKNFSLTGSQLQLPANEPVETGTLTATVEAGPDNDIGAPASTSVDIVPFMTVRPEQATYTVLEDVGTLSVKVIARTGNGGAQPSSAFGVYIETSSETATFNQDFTPLTSEEVTFQPGNFSADGAAWKAVKTVQVTILDDTREEPDEAFQFRLERTGGLDYRILTTNADGTANSNPFTRITIEDDERRPRLTLPPGSIKGVPERHDGVTPFDFTLEFSAAVDFTNAEMAEALQMETRNATVSAKAGDSRRMWTITATPNITDYSQQIAITIRSPERCNEAGAICTADGRKLKYSRVVGVQAGGLKPRPPNPLTVGYILDDDDTHPVLDYSHRAGSDFDFQLVFSEPLANAPRTGDAAARLAWWQNKLTVNDGGTLRAVLYIGDDGLDAGREVWQITVRPGIKAQTGVMVPKFTGGCTASNALCTAAETDPNDRRKLTTALHVPMRCSGGSNNCDGSPVSQPQVAADPLTAAFSNMPESHDGSTAFTFRLTFSEDVDISAADLKDHALTVTNGAVTTALALNSGTAEWDITLQPTGAGSLNILVSPTSDCAATGALCTAAGTMLSAGLGQSIPYAVPVAPQAQAAPAALAASFVSVPQEHDGSSAFWLELSFDAAVAHGSKRHIRALLGVTGGSVTRLRRKGGKGGRLDHWQIRIQPSSHEAVTVTLSPSPPCGATGAVCTEDGRTYTTALATRIQGPPGLTVADAEVQEGPNAVLSFAVTLSRAPSSTVTVDYATADGTATAGSDYTAVSGALTFAAGETEKTVSVAVLDDAHDEGSETLTLTLSNASGAHIADGAATGTINNTDHMPKAWLARFGRTVAEQVLDAVGARVEGNSNSPGPAQLTLGGHRVVLGASWSRAEDTLLGEAGVLGQDLRDVKDLLRAEADASPAREVSTAGLLMASSFHMASAGGEGEDDARWSLWARGSRSSFSGREDALTLEGDVSTGVMGADYERGRVLAGVALAYSAGEGSYTEADARGEVESTLLSAYPYLRYTLSERLSVWSVLGLGEGGLTLDVERNDERIETDISLAMAAFGARGKLLSVAGYDLAVKTDVLFVRTESEAATGLAAADARTRRLRLTLEGSREVKFESGVLTPSLEIGLRHDGGDAETGSGLELGGGLRWAGLKGFSVEVRARGLLAHEESDYEEWGVSASIGLSPGEGDRGFSMRVGSAWGAAAGGVERLWSQRALAGSSFDPDARLDAEVGYGLDAMRGLLTPYTGLSLSESGETWRAGARFRLSSALELNLEASLTEPAGDGEPASGLVLRGTKRW